MFVSKMLNQDSQPVLEQMLQFTAARHKVLAENIANIDTPNYRQKDLSVERFQQVMRDRLDKRESAPVGSVSFDDINGELTNPNDGILFHDGNNRSAEQLMSEFAKNALMHNMAVEMLRKQYSMMEMALKERVG
jgi:flagellar basal-body rod protein FlgB